MQSNETPLTPTEAWDHFWKHVKDTIWDGLDNKQKNRLVTANRDALGKRMGVRGKIIRLGDGRIEALLTEFAPGRYRIEKHILFYVNDK